MKIPTTEYASFYAKYIALGEENQEGIVANLQSSLVKLFESLSTLPEEKQLYAYADGKWTIKELLLHIIETERIMAYRALRISRNDQTNIPGFDQDNYVLYANANEIPFVDLLKEFSLVRKSSIAMFKSFNDVMLGRVGTASESTISTRALGFILSGHVLHHLSVLNEKYL